jgi:hypothetical protein
MIALFRGGEWNSKRPAANIFRSIMVPLSTFLNDVAESKTAPNGPTDVRSLSYPRPFVKR